MSEKKTWRVAFIGTGMVVQWSHIPSFRRLEGVEAVAVCDVNEERVRSVAKDTGIPQAFTDYREMLEKVQPDITVVATPNIFHKPMTLAALEAGSHVLCEKPLALTYADAKEMMDFAAEKGKILTVGTHYRYSAPMQAAKADVDDGFFGEIYAARTVWQRRAGIPGYGSWFTNRDLAGGGSLLDIGVHALDRVLYLMGYPEAVSVTGVSYDKLGKLGVGLGGWGLDISKPGEGVRYDVDDLTWAFVRFANGVSLIFQVAWASHLPEQFFAELYGTKGGANVTNREGVDLYTVLNGQQAHIETNVPVDKVSSYAHLIENFVARLNGDALVDIITPEQALSSVRIVDGIMRSAALGCEVKLDD